MRCYIVDSVIGKYEEKEDLYVLPILMQIGDQTHIDDKDFDHTIIENALREKKKITTSQPSIGKTMELIETLKEKYDEFVFIHTGSKISGTFGASVSVATQEELNFIAIDSKGVGPHILKLMELAYQNKQMTLNQLETLLNKKAENAGALIIPGALERLVLSGRISKFQFAVGQLLQVVPIFILEDGVLKVLKKERTRKKAIESLIKEFEDKKIQDFSILEYNLSELEMIKNRMNVKESTALHTSLLIHFGEGSFGILY